MSSQMRPSPFCDQDRPGVALVRRYRSSFLDSLSAIESETVSGLKWLERYVELYRSVLRASSSKDESTGSSASRAPQLPWRLSSSLRLREPCSSPVGAARSSTWTGRGGVFSRASYRERRRGSHVTGEHREHTSIYVRVSRSTGVDRNSSMGIPSPPTRSTRACLNTFENAARPGNESRRRPLFTSIARSRRS